MAVKYVTMNAKTNKCIKNIAREVRVCEIVQSYSKTIRHSFLGRFFSLEVFSNLDYLLD